MKFIVTAVVMTCILLTGCAPKLTPYQLTKSVELDYRLPRNQIPFGVTQEKISDMEYRITAKVSQYSSKHRASSMALYHAAILAEQKGYDAIFIRSNLVSPGCSRSGTTYIKRTPQTSEVMHRTSITDAEPFASIKIKFRDFSTSKIQNKLLLVEAIKAEHKAIIHTQATGDELEQIRDKNLEECKLVFKQARKKLSIN